MDVKLGVLFWSMCRGRLVQAHGVWEWAAGCQRNVASWTRIACTTRHVLEQRVVHTKNLLEDPGEPFGLRCCQVHE